MHRILVTGARSKTGAPLVDRLSRRHDVELRAGSSNPAHLEGLGEVTVSFSWDHAATWPAAVDGVDAVFVVRPDREDTPELLTAFLATVPAATHVVLVSELNRGYFSADDWAVRVEDAVRTSGHTWTVLQPGWFMQNFTDPRFFLEDIATRGVLPFVSGGQPVAWIDTRDIASVAERALTEPGHHGRIYEMTGPEALTLSHSARLLAEAARHPVEHVEITMDEALGDSTGFARDVDYGALDRVRLGLMATPVETVADVTDTPATTLEAYLEDFGAILRHAQATLPS